MICQLGEQRLETDTHFRAKNGKASWNWRFKFNVTMSTYMKYNRLILQLWDRDITADDCGGEAVLDLTRPWFKRMFAAKKARPTYWLPFEEEWNVAQKSPRAKLVSAAEMKTRGLGKFSSLVDVAEEV